MLIVMFNGEKSRFFFNSRESGNLINFLINLQENRKHSKKNPQQKFIKNSLFRCIALIFADVVKNYKKYQKKRLFFFCYDYFIKKYAIKNVAEKMLKKVINFKHLLILKNNIFQILKSFYCIRYIFQWFIMKMIVIG